MVENRESFICIKGNNGRSVRFIKKKSSKKQQNQQNFVSIIRFFPLFSSQFGIRVLEYHGYIIAYNRGKANKYSHRIWRRDFCRIRCVSMDGCWEFHMWTTRKFIGTYTYNQKETGCIEGKKKEWVTQLRSLCKWMAEQVEKEVVKSENLQQSRKKIAPRSPPS